VLARAARVRAGLEVCHRPDGVISDRRHAGPCCGLVCRRKTIAVVYLRGYRERDRRRIVLRRRSG
jgi:hypothetical protein